jgi:hypothetical protein
MRFTLRRATACDADGAMSVRDQPSLRSHQAAEKQPVALIQARVCESFGHRIDHQFRHLSLPEVGEEPGDGA